MNHFFRYIAAAAVIVVGAGIWLHAQDQTTFRVKVDMVVLGFTVTDAKGKYVNGLKPKDFTVYEDDITEKLSTFAEGNRPPMQVLDNNELRPLHSGSAMASDNGAPRPQCHGFAV